MRLGALLAVLLLLALLLYLPQRQLANDVSPASGKDASSLTAAQESASASAAMRRSDADNAASIAATDSSAANTRRAGHNPFRDQSGRASAAIDSNDAVSAESAQLAQQSAALSDTAVSAASVAELVAEDEVDNEQTTVGSISGRVMDDQGEPVAGAAVLATQQPDASGKRGGEQFAASTAADGWFSFNDLPQADYIISARDPVSGASSNSVRAGIGTALVDLLLPLLNEVLLFGAVTDAQQQPVAGARVILAPAAITTSSDGLGVYLLSARLRNRQSYQIMVEHAGFADARVALPKQDWRQTPEWQLDVQLEREDETTVSGRLLDDNGTAVSDENLYLQSQSNSNSYQARSDAAGGFTFDAVVPGAGYELTVTPSRGYNSYQQAGIEVPTAGLQGVEVVLQALDEGQVTGQFVDPFGTALPGFTADLLVQRFRTTVQADAQGRFMLDAVPAGAVQLRNDSRGRSSTRGASLAAGGQLQLLAVVDVGNAQYVGTLLNEVGMPVPGASITLLWRRQDQGLLHESARTAISDANGRFAFSGHAQVEHELRVVADGYQPLITALAAPTSSSELRLQPLP